MKKILMIVNPVAGEGEQQDFTNEVKSYCEVRKIELQLYYTQGQSDVEKVKQTLQANSYDAVFSAGGDGTFTQFAQLLIEHQLPLGIIPQGTSNGMATDLGISANPMEAFQNLIESQKSIKVDQLLINNELPLYHIGDIGANANLIKSFESSEDSGYAAYSKHLIQQFQNKTTFNYQIQTSEKSYRGSAYMIALCNARNFGSGIPLNELSHPADGKFELVIFKKLDLQTLIESGISSLWEGLVETDENEKEVIQCEWAELSVSPKTLFQIDGEVQQKVDKLEVKLKANQLNLLCQSDCPYLT